MTRGISFSHNIIDRGTSTVFSSSLIGTAAIRGQVHSRLRYSIVLSALTRLRLRADEKWGYIRAACDLNTAGFPTGEID